MKKVLVALALTASFSWQAAADTITVAKALDANDLVQAQQAFKALNQDELASIDVQILKGRFMLASKEYEDAYELFESLSEQYTENVAVNFYFAVSAMNMAQIASIFSKLGYAEDFIAAMEKTIALDPQHLDGLKTLVGFHLFAPGIAGGDEKKALSYAKQIKNFNPEQGFSQLTQVYWQTDKKDLAQQTFDEGIKQFPQSYALYFTRGMAYVKEENWSLARADLTKAIEFANDDEQKSKALYQQGKVSAESGQEISIGIAALEQALPIADQAYQPWVQYRLAQLYTVNKELKRAKELTATININDDDELKSKVKKLNRKLKKLMS